MGHHHHIEGKKLFIAIVLNTFITVAQFIGGLLSGSLALLGDALHNFSDVMSLLLSYGAHKISHRPVTQSRTFGYRRAEIVAALFNAAVLVGVSFYLIVESFTRLGNPEPVAALWVMALAFLGVVVNGLSVVLLHMDAKQSLNIRAAYLHMLSDMLTSVAVLAGGAAMYWFGLFWIDPLISILIALYLIYASWGIIKASFGMVMQFAPEGVNTEAVIAEVESFGAVENIHHIHLWQLSDHEIFLEAHLRFKEDMRISEVAPILEKLTLRLQEKLGVTHTTFQSETGSCPLYRSHCR